MDCDSKGIDVSGDATCGKELKVYVEVYATGGLREIGEASVKREESACRSSSSAEQSSSSTPVVSKSFVPVSFGGASTLTISLANGANLSTAASVAASEADIYYDGTTIKTDKSSVKIVDEFERISGCNYISTGAVATPEDTQQLIPCGADKSSVGYTPNRYYLVKTTSAEDWGPGWYLVRSETSGIVAETSIDIMAWKVN
jgi:hypothetical protein